MISRPALCLSVALLLGLAGGAAWGVPMYSWVDEHGRVNISDTVPEQFRKSARRIESTRFNVSEKQRREAAVRMAALTSAAASRPAGAARAPLLSGPAFAAPRSAAGSAPEASDCATRLQRFREAQDCFQSGPRNQNGTVNAAKSNCPDIVDPSPQCGLPAIAPGGYR